MRKIYPLFLYLLFFAPCFSQPTLSYQSFLTGFTAPVEVVNAGDGSNRLFIVQQNGIIRVYDPANGGLQTTPFLTISSAVTYAGERGLLSMAFHPDYENNGYFFVYYNNTAGNLTLARYAVSANRNVADGSSGVVLMTFLKTRTNHNGGHLQFGKDGHLYFGTGDSGGVNDPDNAAQDSTSLLGKMIRINVDNFTTAPFYTIPSSNPFVGNPAVDDHIWALGLRNPFRWSFDRQTGDMWIGDVGQGAREEINFQPAASTGGENYGWRCYEGNIPTPGVPACDPPGHILPIFDYVNPDNSGASVIGGYVYRGTEYPSFAGWYLASDAYTNTLYLVRPDGSGGWTVASQAGPVSFVVGFGEAEDGTLYAVSQGSNTVYKIVAPLTAPLPIVLQVFSGKSLPQGTALQWTTAAEEAGARFIIEYSVNGRQFTRAGEVAASGAASGESYSFIHPFITTEPLLYRLQLVEANGNRRYSALVKIAGRTDAVRVYPTVVRDGQFFVSSTTKIKQVQVLNSAGVLVMKKRMGGPGNALPLQLPPLAKGLYFVVIEHDGHNSHHKVVVE